MSIITKSALCVLVLLQGLLGLAHADEDVETFEQELSWLQEEEVNILVTIASRQEEGLFQTSSAVYVITGEDIRRSGLRSIAELLRLVPGMHVGRNDANKWAINARNVNSRFSSKMLVLMDGRTLYTPLFAGVYWDAQDTLLEDIKQIEVVRGPGATLWGANAVNGIVNIITKSASATRGGLAYAGGGEGELESDGGIRYGGQLADNLFARFYLKGKESDHGVHLKADHSSNDGFFRPGNEATDNARLRQGGFRLDWEPTDTNHVTIQGDLYGGTTNDVRTANGGSKNRIALDGANLLVRWSHTFSKTANMQLQTYFDKADRQDAVFDERRDTFDLDFQHSFALQRQLLTWGFGYRETSDNTKSPGLFTLSPAKRADETFTLFMQDKIGIVADKIYLTLGSKFEDNDYTGFEYQPSVRVLWTPDLKNTIWAALTRAVRTPSRADADSYLDFNSFPFASFCSRIPGFVDDRERGCIIPIGDKKAKSQVIYSHELGYRTKLNKTLSIDTALFYDRYFDSNTILANDPTKYIYGGEIQGSAQMSKDWRLVLSYAYHTGKAERDDGKEYDISELNRHNAQLRSYWSVSATMELDTSLYYTDHISTANIDFPSYTRFDIRLGWKPLPAVELSVGVTNLFDDVHSDPAVTDSDTKINTGIRRGIQLNAHYLF